MKACWVKLHISQENEIPYIPTLFWRKYTLRSYHYSHANKSRILSPLLSLPNRALRRLPLLHSLSDGKEGNFLCACALLHLSTWQSSFGLRPCSCARIFGCCPACTTRASVPPLSRHVCASPSLSQCVRWVRAGARKEKRMCGKEEREGGGNLFERILVCVFGLETAYKMNEICW